MDIFKHEMHLIFTDAGVMIIFFLAGLAYPLLYNLIYLNGLLEDTPIAVVDNSDCAESRRFINEIDATRECRIAYHCISMNEAEKLMQERKVNGIIYFPEDFGKKLNRLQTATVSLYTDMSSFLYYKNALLGTNMVMLHEIGKIQIERYAAMGYSGQEASQIVQAIPYEDNNPYNNAFSYRFFLVSAILFIIIQQTMFYGMSLLVGTAREENRSFATLPDKLEGNGIGRVILGRGMAYWLIYMGIGIYIALIVPAIFGFPQKGSYIDMIILVTIFVTDCVMFSEACSSLITKRESVFVLFLFMSVVCLFLTGTSWPVFSFPRFWKIFSYIFPTTFGCRGFININAAGGNLWTIHDQIIILTIQTIVYYCISYISIYIENWLIKHKKEIKETKTRLAAKAGIDLEEDKIIIAGKSDEN
jgi:ABC-2 type transport system permease protein